MRVALAVAALLFVSAPARADCPRTADAIMLANEADKVMAFDLDDAIAKLSEGAMLDPENHAILGKLALAHAKKENWSRAFEMAKRAAELAPAFATHHALAGHALVQLAKWSAAKASLERAIATDPNLAEAHFDLGTTLEHLRDEQGALGAYTRAVRAAPDHAAYFAALASLYKRLGYDDFALSVAGEGLSFAQVDRDRFDLLLIAGSVLESQKKLPEATLRFEEAKRACGQCNERGQAIIFFRLGAAYARANPRRAAEAAANLQSFQKMICKGGAAMRYAVECTEAQELFRQVSTTP